jgi:hypothetical protein
MFHTGFGHNLFRRSLAEADFVRVPSLWRKQRKSTQISEVSNWRSYQNWDGARFEHYKMTLQYDNPQARFAHGYPIDTAQLCVHAAKLSPLTGGLRNSKPRCFTTAMSAVSSMASRTQRRCPCNRWAVNLSGTFFLIEL